MAGLAVRESQDGTAQGPGKPRPLKPLSASKSRGDRAGFQQAVGNVALADGGRDECCRTFRMSTVASLKMSTGKRAFRALGVLAVATLSEGCSW